VTADKLAKRPKPAATVSYYHIASVSWLIITARGSNEVLFSASSLGFFFVSISIYTITHKSLHFA